MKAGAVLSFTHRIYDVAKSLTDQHPTIRVRGATDGASDCFDSTPRADESAIDIGTLWNGHHIQLEARRGPMNSMEVHDVGGDVPVKLMTRWHSNVYEIKGSIGGVAVDWKLESAKTTARESGHIGNEALDCEWVGNPQGVTASGTLGARPVQFSILRDTKPHPYLYYHRLWQGNFGGVAVQDIVTHVAMRPAMSTPT
jgi:hypothetical protein